MKKALIALGIIIVLFLVAAIILPIVLKEPIKKAVIEEANKNLNAKINFSDVSLSLFRSFPDLFVGINDLSVIGVAEFEGDTLVYLKTLGLDVNVMSAIKGSPVINHIKLADGLVSATVLKDGKASYDIVPESEGPAETPATEPTAFQLEMKKFSIANVEIRYDDREGGTKLTTSALDMTLSGDFTADNTSIDTEVSMKRLTVVSGGIPFLSRAELELKASVDADLKNMQFVLKDNALRINGLNLVWQGNVGMPNDNDITMDLTFGAPKTDFKEILSLIPAVYMTDFASVKTSGNLTLKGFAKGTYNETNLPAFNLDLKVADGSFQYPDLPKKVEEIAIDLNVRNPGGDADKSIIDLKNFHFQMAGNPFDVRMLIKTPTSDPDIDASFKGKLDLGSVADVMPLEKEDRIKGTLIADADLKGRQSWLDSKQYDRFVAKGEFILMDFEYATASIAVPVSVKYAQFKFEPSHLQLAAFEAKAGSSDIKASGRIDNYLGYALKDELLKGRFDISSNLLDVNQLMGIVPSDPNAPAESAPAADAPASTEPLLIPQNLDVALGLQIGKILLDNMTLTQLKGNATVREGKADLSGLTFNTLGGGVAMSGNYDTRNEKKPGFNFDLNVNEVVLKEAFSTFNTMKKLAPFGEKAEGRVSIQFKVQGMMKGMEADLNSLSGGGRLMSKSLKISGTETLNKITEVIKLDYLKNPELKDLNLSFKFDKGRVSIDPFDVKVGPVAANIGGSHGFDETMDYVMKTSIPTAALGAQAGAVIGGLSSAASKFGVNLGSTDKINVDMLVKGTFAKPIITPSFGGSGGASAGESLKNMAEEEFNKQKDELERKAREEADKLKGQAEQEAARLKKEAEDRAKAEAEKLKKEAEKRAKKEAEDRLKGLFGKPKK
ncbi:MAG: AsmA family protein [Flavobacteriales bacterium]|nr:AsmA family protein [Flavobacteriales bacterium]